MDSLLKKQKQKLKRAAKLTQVLSKYGFEDFKSKIDNNNEENLEQSSDSIHPDQAFYERIRRALEELGPTYIKFGQTLSTREDLFPSGLVKELKKLQDNVAVEQWDIIEIIQNELNIDPKDYFVEIEDIPLASASIAQTYRAQLQDGSKVILKIKRPGIRDIVHGDLLLMKDIIDLLSNYYSVVREINLAFIFDAFAKNLYEELSFINELKNINQFARNFKNEPDVQTMKGYADLSTDNLLCISFIEGCKINDLQGLQSYNLDKDLILDKLLNLFLGQILEHGFFHADPHPGNILVTPKGKIAFIDLGAMARMLSSDQELLEDFIIYFLNKDAKRLLATIKKMSIHIDIKNEKLLERAFLELMEAIDGKSLQDIDIKALFTKFSHILNENSIIMPEHIYLLVKGIVLMEGIGRELAPEVNVIEKIKPYISKITAQRMSPDKLFENSMGALWEAKRLITGAPQTFSSVVDKINNGEINVQIDSKEFQNHRNQQARNNSLNRLVILACTTFLGACILANTPHYSIWGIALISWILIAISLLIGIKLIIKKYKI